MESQRLVRFVAAACAVCIGACGGGDSGTKAPASSEAPTQPSASGAPAATTTTKTTTAAAAGSSSNNAASSSAAGQPKSGGDVMDTSAAHAGTGGTPAMTSAAEPAAGSGGTLAMVAAGAGGAPGSTTDDAADPSPGCSGGTLKPGEGMQMLQSGGMARVYVQHIPDKYDGKTPMPVVLDLHGGSYDGPRWVDVSGFKKLGDTEGFITLFPSGTDNSWGATEQMSADGQFLKDLIAEIGKTGCIDRKRIYSTGCSMGGAMSFWMGCFASDLIAAIAPMCGTPFFALDMCKPAHPLPVMLTIGETDNLNCWEGMPAGIGNPCAMTTFEYFKGVDMCTGDAKDTHNGVCHTYDSCANGAEVTACKSNTGHGVYTATNIEVTNESWKFLKRFHL